MNRRTKKANQLARKQQPGYFWFRLDDSDGNDNSVYDLIVEARKYTQAVDRVSEFLDRFVERSGHESDGMWGTYAPCNCHCDHQSIGFCDEAKCQRAADRLDCSHGGVTIDVENPDTRTKHATHEDARRRHGSIWHRQILIDIDGSVR